jgi:hypothetical protein
VAFFAFSKTQYLEAPSIRTQRIWNGVNKVSPKASRESYAKYWVVYHGKVVSSRSI